MSTERFDRTLHAAIAAGILPAGAIRPAQDARPWPVVLLTGLGAWLAAVPLLGVVGMLLGDLIHRGVGPYLIGVLVLIAALVVLRSKDLPLFVEQLAVPALLVGGGSLAFGLFRDLPMQGAAALLAVVAVGIAIAIRQPWLRVLLGAAAALLTTFACMPEHWVRLGRDARVAFWLAWHLVLAIALVALWVQRTLLTGGKHARHAAAIESLAAGWLLTALAGLAFWSGMSFMVGASLGGGVAGELARELGTRSSAWWQIETLRATSLILALGAALWLALGRGLARGEPEARHRHVRDPVDAEGAPFGAVQVEGDQVPAPPGVDQPQRLDRVRDLAGRRDGHGHDPQPDDQ